MASDAGLHELLLMPTLSKAVRFHACISLLLLTGSVSVALSGHVMLGGYNNQTSG